jgi:hypothetical protein
MVSVSTHSCSLCTTIIPLINDVSKLHVSMPWRSPPTRTIVGCTQCRALSGEYVLIYGTQQSSLPSAICNSSIVASTVVEPLRTPSTGTIVRCTQSVSVPICALSGEYVLIHGTQQSSLPSAICYSSIVASPSS